ncbi:MAG: methyltransferase domain-containing protein [SAR324 cluster bacterium]|nr:methyltransferase domain-containing protein [SAR324 cluster bacterium]
MAEEQKFDPAAFKQFEHDGWGEVAGTYHDTFGGLTRLTVEALLDAAEVKEGTRLLDVACGTGNVTAAAHARGAKAAGLDFVAAMVSEARGLHPEVEFTEGDAEAMPFDDGKFEAVVSNFGLRHFPHPERALAEFFRVLAPGGRFAASDWIPPGVYGTIIMDALEAAGHADAPPASVPPPYNFADQAAFGGLLKAAGFSAPEMREVTLLTRYPSPMHLLDTIYKGSVNVRNRLEALGAEARDSVNRAIVEIAGRHEKNGAIEIPAKALIASALKP